MKLVKILSVFALSNLLLTACFTSSPSTTILNNKKSSLYNAQWKLVDDENTVVKGLNGDAVYIQIDSAEFKVNGYAGCNLFHTDAALDGSTITFGPIGSTKMRCPDSRIEDSFLNVLDDVNRYEIKGNELYFYKGNMLLLKFVQ